MSFLSIPFTLWAVVFAYGIWAWRDVRFAQMKHCGSQEQRAQDNQERMMAYLERLAHANGMPPAPGAPIKGDNILTPSWPFQKKPGDKPNPDDAA